jgi:hypothetical protein
VKLEVDANTAKVIVCAALLLHKMTIRTKTKETSICDVEDAATAYVYFFSWTWYGNVTVYVYFFSWTWSGNDMFCVAILQYFSSIS